MDEKVKEVAAYVARNVRNYESRLAAAIDEMYAHRCSLRHVASDLFEEIVDAVADWCNDNEVSLDFYEDWDDLIEGDEGIIWVEL